MHVDVSASSAERETLMREMPSTPSRIFPVFACQTQWKAPPSLESCCACLQVWLFEAIYAKEPFHVQLVKLQAALTRAEEVAEKKHSAVWTAREGADKAD